MDGEGISSSVHLSVTSIRHNCPTWRRKLLEPVKSQERRQGVRSSIVRFFFRIYWNFVTVLSMPMILAEYFFETTGGEYGVGYLGKLSLARKMIRNNRKIVTASHFLEHLVMTSRVLKIPKSVEGCVVECGSYKGGSTANLSLVCALSNRQLDVFDSFEGLPEPSDHDRAHTVVSRRQVHTYSRGAWCGSLEEVRNNVSQFGNVSVCNFHVGYYKDTLPRFGKKCAFIFLDVDLRDSLESCVRYLWPLLEDECYLFTHEAHHNDIAFLFFDKEWWRANLNCDPPGLIGAGSGLGLFPGIGGFWSALGYTIKNPRVSNFEQTPQRGL